MCVLLFFFHLFCKPSRILEQKRIDLKRLKVELMAVKENIAKMRCAHPDRMEKLKVWSNNKEIKYYIINTFFCIV